MKAKLDPAWREHCKLLAEARRLWGEGDKLYAEADKLQAKATRLFAEGDKVRATGNNLWGEARNLWRGKVTEVCGANATIEWSDTGCIVLGVMEFVYES